MRSIYTLSSQKRHKYRQAVSLFALLGSLCVNADRKMVVKSTPWVNFINVLQAAFTRAEAAR